MPVLDLLILPNPVAGWERGTPYGHPFRCVLPSVLEPVNLNRFFPITRSTKPARSRLRAGSNTLEQYLFLIASWDQWWKRLHWEIQWWKQRPAPRRKAPHSRTFLQTIRCELCQEGSSPHELDSPWTKDLDPVRGRGM